MTRPRFERGCVYDQAAFWARGLPVPGLLEEEHMVKSQGRWARSLAYGATALLVIAACAGNTATPVPPTAPTGTTTPAATPTAKPATSTTPQSAPPSTEHGFVDASATSAEPSASTSTESGQPTGSGEPGGTIYMLKNATDFDYYDPQRVYTGEDLAFFGATIMRALVAYKYSPDPAEGVTIVPDMATDTRYARRGCHTVDLHPS